MPLSGKALAEAYVRVRADMSQVGPDVQAEFAKAVETAGKAGNAAGAKFADGMAVKMKGAVAKPLQGALAGAGGEAARAGQDAGGKFAGGVASKMKGAVTQPLQLALDLGPGLAGKAGEETGAKFAAGAAGKLKDAVSKPLQDGLAAGTSGAARDGEQAGAKFRAGVASQVKGTAGDAEKAGHEAGKRFSEGETFSIKEGFLKLSETMHEGLKAGILGLTAGLAGMGAVEVFKEFINGAEAARKAAALTEQVISSTGGAADVTAEDVDKLALAISNKTGIDDDAVHAGENLLLTFTNIRNEVGKGNDIFNQATGIMTDMSVALGQDMSNSAIQLGKALNDPIHGITALQRVGVSFTDSQKAQIAEMVKAGHTAEAQKVILAELGREFGGAAEAASTPMGILQVHLENIGKTLAGQLLPGVDKTAIVLNDGLLPALETGIGLIGSIPGPVYAAAGAFTVLRLGMLATTKAADKVKSLGGVGGTITTGMSRLKGAATDLMDVFGGPWGIAFAGASVAVGAYIQHQQEAKAWEDQFRSSLDQTTGALTDQNVQMVANKLQQEGILGVAQQLGVNLGDVTDAALGNAAAYARIRAQLGPFLDQANQVHPVVGYSTQALSANASQATRLMDALDGSNGAVKASVDAFYQGKTAAAQVKEALKGTTSETDRNKAATQAATAALTAWNTAMQAASSQFLKGRQTERAYKDAIDAATAAVKSNGRSLNDNTAKGRANEAALDAVTSSGQAYIQYLVDSKAPGAQVRAEWEAQRRKLLDVYGQFNKNKGKALDYVNNALGKVPPSVTTTVKTPGLTAAQQAFNNLTKSLKAIPNEHVTLRVNGDGSVTKILTAAGHTTSTKYSAAGGYITGPGGPREDRVPAMLSNGEYVINAAATSRHRQLLDAINSGQHPAGYAGGGIVNNVRDVVNIHNIPNNVDGVYRAGLNSILATYAKTMAAQAKASAAGNVYGTNVASVGSGVRRWAGLVQRVLAMEGLSASLVGTVLAQMTTESGGNPNAINLWDSNAAAGDPSKGLMQVIGGTFRAYHWPGTSWNIYDPTANVAAALNYASHRYGPNLSALGHGHGYATGTLNAAPGWRWVGEHGPELLRFRGGEQVKSAAASRAMASSSSGAGDLVRLHPDTVAQLGSVIGAAMTRQPVVLDGRTVAGYVDRSLGVRSMSVRG